ncbi:hypothetical protein RRG08_021108 [Elysia crispata]|uniref:Uncharacterized protein n=1 Tax=Elysia crispata TaxID=231223 RepID=A0AAE0Z605_9GAST|nr:hypothetical protein RRG08_021108 [Elysia crispata]
MVILPYFFSDQSHSRPCTNDEVHSFITKTHDVLSFVADIEHRTEPFGANDSHRVAQLISSRFCSYLQPFPISPDTSF